VTVIDGREELVREIRELPDAARQDVCEAIEAILALPSFAYGVEGSLPAGSSDRAAAITIPRFIAIAAR
jgi:hypothetical protein